MFFFIITILIILCLQKENIKPIKIQSPVHTNNSPPVSSKPDIITPKTLLNLKKITPEHQISSPVSAAIKTLRGEEDSNGVRHDVNLWIADQPITYDQKLALLQLARSMQLNLLNSERINQLDIADGRKEAEKLAVNIMKSMKCIIDKFKDETDPFAYSYSLEKLMLNNENRINANEQFDRALSGAAIVFPAGDPCEE